MVCQTGHDFSCLTGPLTSAVACSDPFFPFPQSQLVGKTYQVRREGDAGSFALKFQGCGVLAVTLNGQDIQEMWQPVPWNPSAILIGGRTMPTAVVVIGLRGQGGILQSSAYGSKKNKRINKNK